MAWGRKSGRYAWGREVENNLRKIIAPYMPANCRSSRSGGLFDVWGAGHHVYLFQCKRTESQKNVHGFVGVASLLRAYERAVTARDVVKIVAVYHRRKHPGQHGVGLHWRFFVSERDYQKLRLWAGA